MKLLIFSPDSYSVFHTDTSFIFGGAEIETGYHAKGLAEKGIDVVVVTRDQGISTHVFKKISIVPHPGLKGAGYWEKRKTLAGRIAFRLFGDKKSKLSDEELFHEINPDAAYVMGMSPEALHLSRYCKKNNKKFIFRVAHDQDLGGEFPDEQKIRKWANLSLNELHEIISNASIVLTQTPLQQELLKRNFNRIGEMMFPPIELNRDVEKSNPKYDVLWVGKNNTFKRPEQLIELARRLPQRKFCMILNNIEDVSWKKIISDLPENIELIESVPADEIENYFRASKLFVSTSLHEGFANTFLQAGKNAVPVLSMGSDPNGMLSVHQAGILVGDHPDKLEKSVEQLLSDSKELEKYSNAAKNFVEKFHDKEEINIQFHKLLMQL